MASNFFELDSLDYVNLDQVTRIVKDGNKVTFYLSDGQNVSKDPVTGPQLLAMYDAIQAGTTLPKLIP